MAPLSTTLDAPRPIGGRGWGKPKIRSSCLPQHRVLPAAPYRRHWALWAGSEGEEIKWTGNCFNARYAGPAGGAIWPSVSPQSRDEAKGARRGRDAESMHKSCRRSITRVKVVSASRAIMSIWETSRSYSRTQSPDAILHGKAKRTPLFSESALSTHSVQYGYELSF